MKKKLMTIVAALAIMAFGTTALAADSPSAGTTKVDTTVAEGQKVETAATAPTTTPAQMLETSKVEAEGVTVAAVQKTTVDESVTAAKNVLTDVKALSEIVATVDTKAAESLKTATTNADAKVTASVKVVLNLSSTETNKKVVVNNPEIKTGKTYVVLHYTGKGWETLPAKVEADGKLSFTANSFSAFAVVEVAVEKVAENTPAPTTTPAQNQTTSPDTGDSIPASLFVLLLCVAGAVVCAKKVRA